MPPKFQSSFIPKSPLTSNTPNVLRGRGTKGKSLMSVIAFALFVISIVLAVGVFGYKYYLNYRVNTMEADLEQALTTIQPEPEIIRELIRFDDRVVSTQELVTGHRVLSPLFEFLESSTPVTVRFSDFQYAVAGQGLQLTMSGEARGYAALALQAEVFDKSGYFTEAVFSNLNLNERGDVRFTFNAVIDPSLLSYSRLVESVSPQAAVPTIEDELLDIDAALEEELLPN